MLVVIIDPIYIMVIMVMRDQMKPVLCMGTSCTYIMGTSYMNIIIM